MVIRLVDCMQNEVFRGALMKYMIPLWLIIYFKLVLLAANKIFQNKK